MNNFTNKLKTNLSAHFKTHKEKYLKSLSIFFIAASAAFLLWALTKTVVSLFKNRNNPTIIAFLAILASVVFFLNCSFVYFKFFDAKNKVALENITKNENISASLKECYEDDQYLKIKKLKQIKLTSKILILISAITAFIVFKMGSKNSKFKDALIPVLFIFFICLILITFNNFLSWKIENDLEKFDKKIFAAIKETKGPSLKEEFKIFNQLMLERDFSVKSIHVNNFEDSVLEHDSVKSFFKKILSILCDCIGSFADSLKNLVKPETKKIYANKKIDENFQIFNSKNNKPSLSLDPSLIDEIKDLNKENKLLKENGAHNSFFKFLDTISLQENIYKAFV